MRKINLLLTEANGNLSDRRPHLKRATAIAEAYVFPRLKINWNIDVLITNRLCNMLIPEDKVGGRAQASDFIELAIDDDTPESFISEMLVHELCHAARWGKNNEMATSLFDALISEGLATYLEMDFVENHNEKTTFIKTVTGRSGDDNGEILKKVKNQLRSSRYDYETIFFSGSEQLPRWAGYSLGYYLVTKYLERTNKKFENAFVDKYANFWAKLFL